MPANDPVMPAKDPVVPAKAGIHDFFDRDKKSPRQPSPA
jgi:hypothetical protein